MGGMTARWRNSPQGYGRIARALHWLTGLAIVGLFGVGLWMVDLGYGHPWYHTAPSVHKAVGILLMMALALRLAWRWVNPHPDTSHLRPLERRAATWTHRLLYLLLLGIGVSGYLIATVDGHGVDVFGWFTIPSVYQQKGLEDAAGDTHEIMAFAVIIIAAAHALVALKHHFYDRDDTLRRMTRGHQAPPAPCDGIARNTRVE